MNDYVPTSRGFGARVKSDRQPIALVGHDGLETGAGEGDFVGLPARGMPVSVFCKTFVENILILKLFL